MFTSNLNYPGGIYLPFESLHLQKEANDSLSDWWTIFVDETMLEKYIKLLTPNKKSYVYLIIMKKKHYYT